MTRRSDPQIKGTFGGVILIIPIEKWQVALTQLPSHGQVHS